MNKFQFKFLLLPVSRLPYWAVYGLSSVLAPLLGLVYRRKVVLDGLTRSFPSQSSKWVKRVARAHFRHLTDIMVESLKHFTVSEKQVQRRMRFTGLDLMERLYAEGRHVFIAGGHMNNWELYALGADMPLKHATMAIYKRLSDPIMDDMMRKSRERFGLSMVPTVASSTWMKSKLKAGMPPQAVIFGFDQSPANPEKSWWTTFLGRETAWYYGLEKHARQWDVAVVYGHIRKDMRGLYWTEYSLVAEDVNALSEGDVLRRCIALLEEDIERSPEQWLWTHKRWKHSRPEGVALHSRDVEPMPSS